MDDLLSPTEAAEALGVSLATLRGLSLPRVRVGLRVLYRETDVMARARRIADRAVNGLARRLVPGGPVRDVVWSRYLKAEHLTLKLSGRCKCGGPIVKGCPTCKRARGLRKRLRRILEERAA